MSTGRVILILVAIVGAVLAFSLRGILGTPQQQPAPAASASAAAPLLVTYGSTWDPRRRLRLVQSDPRGWAGMHEEVAHALDHLDPRRVTVALRAARELGYEDLALRVKRLADRGPVAVQAEAIQVGESLEAWSDAELARLLDRDEPAVVRAALAVVKRRPERFMSQVLAKLQDPDSGVRAAALEAIPLDAPDDAVHEAIRLAAGGDPATRRIAFAALARMRIDGAIEAFLVEQLEVAEPVLRLAALETLARKRTPLAQPSAVLDVVDDPSASSAERAVAYRCLERTRTFQPLPASEAAGDELTRYSCARLLVSAGRRQGADLLLQLAAPREHAEPWRDELRKDARRILRTIGGNAQDPDSPSFKAWLGSLGDAIPPRRLQDPPPPILARFAAPPQ
jgi:hypothetical protein